MAAEPAACSTGSMGLLVRAMRLVGRRETEVAIGMRLKHLIVLTHLRDRGVSSQQALGDQLAVDANSLVLMLNDIERDGLLERRRDPDDRRRHIVAITPAGDHAIRRAEAKLDTIEDHVLAPLDADERAAFHALLSKIVMSRAAEPSADDVPAAGSR